MFIALLLISTLLEETSESLGKAAFKRKRQTVFDLAFLSLFFTEIFLVVSLFLGARFKVVPASVPHLLIRIALETALSYVVAKSVAHADRSTLGFIRLFAIPIILVSDLALGYRLSIVQVTGVLIMFGGLLFAFRHHANRRGLFVVILVPLLIAASTTLYKWDITHLNSVAGEQIIVYFFVLAFFYFQAARLSGSPSRLLVHRRSGLQSVSNGLGLAIDSFAFSLGPASVVMAVKRTLALMWSVAFGRHYFKETHLRTKLYAGVFVVAGLVMLVSPYL
jgi:hypothetical protein